MVRLRMLPTEQRDFIKLHLGPALRTASLATRILLFDHNLDRIDFPLTTLRDPEAAQYVDGSAFHHYGGEFDAMGALHLARPDKNLYFTEQMIIEQPGQATLEIAAPVNGFVLPATEQYPARGSLDAVGGEVGGGDPLDLTQAGS